VALLTSSPSGAMPETVEVVGESEKEGLFGLAGPGDDRERVPTACVLPREDGFYLRRGPYGFCGKLRYICPRNVPCGTPRRGCAGIILCAASVAE